MNKLFEKGDVILLDGWFYVVIHDKGKGLNCICDNANNVYYWEKEHVQVHMSALQAVRCHAYGFRGELPEEDAELCIETHREIPIDVIAEALVGLHDHRFN